MPELRDYQKELVRRIDKYIADGKGDPVAVLATGAGKSHVIAALLMERLVADPQARLLLLTHQKELIEQDRDKLLATWPEAEVGIYSASVGEKDLSRPITMAGIQSIVRVRDLPAYSFVVIDEAHMVNNEEIGSYRKLAARLKEKRPDVHFVGLTATPYRLAQGMIYGPGTLFSGMVQSISTRQLQERGYLSVLTTKFTETQCDPDAGHSVKVRGGEYVEKELNDFMMNFSGNPDVCDEIVRSADRFSKRHVLVFCTGISHAELITRLLEERGMKARLVTGETPKAEREMIFDSFRSGGIRALVNVNVVTTGFDYPDIDMIAMLRPTKSTALHVQALGRGLRPKSDGSNRCLVLDFVGNTMRHGPINRIRPPRKGSKSNTPEVEPMKVCPSCSSIIPRVCHVCPECGYAPPIKEVLYRLTGVDVNGGIDRGEFFPTRWFWWVGKEKKSGREKLVCFYNDDSCGDSINEMYCIRNDYSAVALEAGSRLLRVIRAVNDAYGCNLPISPSSDPQFIARTLNRLKAPKAVVWLEERGRNSSYLHVKGWIFDGEIARRMKEAERGGWN